jgi:HEAT repeat protein
MQTAAVLDAAAGRRNRIAGALEGRIPEIAFIRLRIVSPAPLVHHVAAWPKDKLPSKRAVERGAEETAARGYRGAMPVVLDRHAG